MYGFVRVYDLLRTTVEMSGPRRTFEEFVFVDL